MEGPGATPPPPEVSPELLQPLVDVVAILGELGATSGDIPLAEPSASLRARLLALVATIMRAMEHGDFEATSLRRALATAGATPEPATVPPGDCAGHGATGGDAWATVATVARAWREAVTSVEAAWATVARDAELLRDACGTVATAGATKVPSGHLAAAMARQDEARQELLVATRRLPVASELATAAEAVTSHRTRVAEAEEQLRVATEATEQAAVATVATLAAQGQRQRAVVAHEAMGRLVAACQRATYCYCHLRRHLENIEAAVATVAAGHGGPEPPGVAQGRPGVPEGAVAAAEALWVTSARLAGGHLRRTLRVARGLLATPGVPNATAAATVARGCQEATAAIPGLLRPRP